MQIDKTLMAGSTTLLVLSLLSEGEKYGYQMIAELARRSDDTFQLKEGTLYPILHALEKEGRVKSFRQEAENGVSGSITASRPRGSCCCGTKRKNGVSLPKR